MSHDIEKVTLEGWASPAPQLGTQPLQEFTQTPTLQINLPDDETLINLCNESVAERGGYENLRDENINEIDLISSAVLYRPGVQPVLHMTVQGCLTCIDQIEAIKSNASVPLNGTPFNFSTTEKWPESEGPFQHVADHVQKSALNSKILNLRREGSGDTSCYSQILVSGKYTAEGKQPRHFELHWSTTPGENTLYYQAETMFYGFTPQRGASSTIGLKLPKSLDWDGDLKRMDVGWEKRFIPGVTYATSWREAVFQDGSDEVRGHYHLSFGTLQPGTTAPIQSPLSFTAVSGASITAERICNALRLVPGSIWDDRTGGGVVIPLLHDGRGNLSLVLFAGKRDNEDSRGDTVAMVVAQINQPQSDAEEAAPSLCAGSEGDDEPWEVNTP